MNPNPLLKINIIPKIRRNIPETVLKIALLSTRNLPIKEALNPSKTNTNVLPAKNANVILVMFLPSPKVYAKNAGIIGKMHGESMLNMPPRNAMKYEIERACWLV